MASGSSIAGKSITQDRTPDFKAVLAGILGKSLKIK
jgi:hypothetical protein